MHVPKAERETFVEQVWKPVTQQSRPDSMYVANGRNLEIKPHHFLAAPWPYDGMPGLRLPSNKEGVMCHGSTPQARAELGTWYGYVHYLSTIVEISDRRGNTR